MPSVEPIQGVFHPRKDHLSRVLVADDEPGFVETTCDILNKAGYAASGASNAEDVIKELQSGSTDILVTDIRMPGCNELDYLNSAQQPRGQVPIIVVTGYPSVGTAAKAVKLPVVAYLTKPLDIEGFLEDVRRAAGFSRIQRSVHRIHEQAKNLEAELQSTKNTLATGYALHSVDRCLEQVVVLLFSNARTALKELEEMISASLQSGHIAHPKGESFRPLALVELLQETVILLERSKRDFKSKELAELRRRIERLLQLPDNQRTPGE